MFHYQSSAQPYIESQMAPYEMSPWVVSSSDLGGVLNVGYRGYLVELEGLSEASPADVFGGSHTISPSADHLNFWLRYRWRCFGTPLYFSPGASIGFTQAELRIWDKGPRDGSTQMLYGSGANYAFGVLSEFGFFFYGLAIAFDYRYRIAEITDVTSLNGGEFFFPSNPEFNYSGHSFAIGLTFYVTSAMAPESEKE